MIVTKKKILPRRKCVSAVYNYTELDIGADDTYMYCEDCQLETIGDCILHPLLPIQDTQVSVGEPDRAKKTLPQGLSLSDSKIKGAGKGVWTDIKIPKFSRFGPYEGVQQMCTDIKKDEVSGYGWLVTGQVPHYIDGKDIERANWLRYVNCARFRQEQNLEAFQHKGKIYYKALFDISHGNELLVWYGDDYATDLGINKDEYAVLSTPPVDSLDCMKYARDIPATLKCKDWDFTSTFNHQSTKTCTSHASSTEKPYVCTQCDYRCVHSGNLQRHMKTHTGEKPYACTQCDYRCVQSGSLQTHMKTHTGEKPYACTQCDYRSARSGSLQTHMKTHTGEKPYACTQCDYRCAHSSNLQTHMKTHTGEKPYACTQCDYRCAHSGSLQMHMKTHTGEKPYACTQCDYWSVQSGNLQRHMKTHTGEKPYACTQCDYRCVQSGSLQTHMKTHTGEKPYACTQCDYRCVQSGSLQSHMKTHTGEKPYACTQCDYRCVQSGSLQSHMKTHTGEKPYVCTQCDYRCVQRIHLQRHMKTHTGGKLETTPALNSL
ncbi:gastrula zinc finger protein XlCGF57.1-like [Watersipora subatra]|uniref:gastrula zinc finger protein XlCGF57.1-like n=1 Tax=Watersipora subatra TaxID=2589382 RepID=UPI00355B3148